MFVLFYLLGHNEHSTITKFFGAQTMRFALSVLMVIVVLQQPQEKNLPELRWSEGELLVDAECRLAVVATKIAVRPTEFVNGEGEPMMYVEVETLPRKVKILNKERTALVAEVPVLLKLYLTPSNIPLHQLPHDVAKLRSFFAPGGREVSLKLIGHAVYFKPINEEKKTPIEIHLQYAIREPKSNQMARR